MNDPREMPFSMHLAELRTCLVRTAAGVLIASIGCFVFADDLFGLLVQPLHSAVENPTLIGTGPAEAFLVKLKVSLVAGIIISAPFSFIQLWAFISPGLHQHERRLAIPFIIVGSLFFFVGISFCFKLILPYAFQFFDDEYRSIGVAATIRIGEYLSFVTKLLLVFGAVFELPVLSYFLTRLGLVSHSWLIRQGRIIVVGIFVVAAILTPPDVVTQLLLAAPLCVLYGLCIGIAYVCRKQTAETASEEEHCGSGA
ncbi:MAG: twin-arginine translocase subunit TatC [Bdellovibrionales bacterium]|nr:twin-arginine translocase subunit TatC [Bdellovibrionales bacterium]